MVAFCGVMEFELRQAIDIEVVCGEDCDLSCLSYCLDPLAGLRGLVVELDIYVICPWSDPGHDQSVLLIIRPSVSNPAGTTSEFLPTILRLLSLSVTISTTFLKFQVSSGPSQLDDPPGASIHRKFGDLRIPIVRRES
jgi:hypothetical protein